MLRVLLFSPYPLEALSLPEPGAWLAASNPPASTLPELRFQHWKPPLASDVGAEDLNLGHHACTTNALMHWTSQPWQVHSQWQKRPH